MLLVLFFCSNPIMVAQEQKLEKEEVVILGKGVKLELVLIPAGKFVLGNIKIGPEVNITKPFYMGKYEVTQEQWFEIMGENPSHYKGRRLPVTNVSWKDCQDFINKLNKLEPFSNQNFRLSTEAEWEYSCRAGTVTKYYFGDKIAPEDANWGDSNTKNLVPVGSYKPNPFGLYDMHGNVREWVGDLRGDYPSTPVFDPKGPTKMSGESYYVQRSSAFYSSNPIVHASSYRSMGKSDEKDKGLGLRLVLIK